jgi:3-methyladenine DNA glycosylase AlkC
MVRKDPSPILPILENLKADPSEYVRRSVANNLNDIAKDNPSLVIKNGKTLEE